MLASSSFLSRYHLNFPHYAIICVALSVYISSQVVVAIKLWVTDMMCGSWMMEVWGRWKNFSYSYGHTDHSHNTHVRVTIRRRILITCAPITCDMRRVDLMWMHTTMLGIWCAAANFPCPTSSHCSQVAHIVVISVGFCADEIQTKQTKYIKCGDVDAESGRVVVVVAAGIKRSREKWARRQMKMCKF